jgi:hypothetical protein
MFGALYLTFCQKNIVLAMSATALDKILLFSYDKKVVLDCF